MSQLRNLLATVATAACMSAASPASASPTASLTASNTLTALSIQAGGHGEEHPNTRRDAEGKNIAEDAHWWLGLELSPELRNAIAEPLGPSLVNNKPSNELSVSHILFGLLVVLIGWGMAAAARRQIVGQVLPPKTWGAAAFFDLFMETCLGLLTNMMPREKALKHLPIVTSVGFFILLSNLLGLAPGFVPPTQSFNTTLALGSIAFIYYNYHGIKTHGVVAYLKHFMGPILALAPLMLVIELISHCVRPVSLGLRLMGNMFGDHQVLFIFMSFGIPLVPLPVMALGTIVCVVQAVVFTLLFCVYLGLAVEEHEHHDHAEDHDHGHDKGHGHAVAAAH